MSSEVLLSVQIRGVSQPENVRLNLDLHDDSEVEGCLQDIDRWRQADSNTITDRSGNADDGDSIAIAYCEDHWEIKVGHYESYASTFDQTLNHIHSTVECSL